jgi:two-component system chemotaxis sensor kinase CheA
VPANLQERIEQLARLAVLSDAGDLPGLVSLQEQAVSLAAEAGEDGVAEIESLARQISALAESIVLRKVEDADAAFREIGAGIDRLQNCLSAPAPDSNAPAQPDDDDALIAAWVSGCEGMLSDLEGRLLALERTPGDTEVIADIRRTMHTLKGECGVLSLHTAQKLFHEAESLIDRCVDSRTPLPIDPFLALLDWVRSYVTRLSTNSHATPDGHDRVLLAITNAHPADAPAPPPVPSATPTAAADTPAPAPAPHAPSAPPAPAATPPAPTAQSPAPQDGVVVDPTPVAFGPQPGTEENLADFICEAKDHLANSEEALLALDQDRTNLELINTVFRAFHTIKGVSGFMALTPIVSLAHSAEQLLDGARSGLFTLGRAELDLILASCDMMTRLLAVLEGSTGPTRGDFETLVRLLDASAKPGAAPAPHHAAPAPVTPSTPASSPNPIAPSPTPNPAAPSTVNAAPTPVASPAPTAAPPATRPAEASQPPLAEGDSANNKVKRADQTVKVNTSRMDSLVTMVGELVIAQQMVVQDVVQSLGGAAQGQRVQRTLSHMGKMIRDLQEVSMSLRMVNLKSTFQKMTRLVRDVSQRAGKQIEVYTEGEDVELDRNVVEAITDPLVHMIRNSCDHGVEPADERRAAGKSPTGRVSLRAYHAGGSIVIEIADDGRGLRREKLLAKAKAKGLLPPDTDDAAMSDAEVYGLIFLPGFSTAEQVTDISGRGVGMDVVRRNIEALRGKIEIRSEPGKGTTFLMRLPLTMAIIDGMIVRVGSQRYVLPTLSINQSFRPRPEDLKTAINVGEMVRVRGDMLPIYRLNRVLALDEGADDIADALLIVMESDDARFCLMVDEILGQQQVVIKSLNQTGQNLRGVSGGAILGDGRVALILDVGQIVSLAREGCGGARRTGAEPATELAISGA